MNGPLKHCHACCAPVLSRHTCNKCRLAGHRDLNCRACKKRPNKAGLKVVEEK